jgi:hypothetical protein
MSVRAMACRGRRSPMSVSGGPGPSLPFSSILWQARQPDWAVICLPDSNVATASSPWATTDGGASISIEVGEPALAPR